MAQDKMLDWAKRKGWSDEVVEQLEGAKDEWNQLKKDLEEVGSEGHVLELVFASKKVTQQSSKFTQTRLTNLINKLKSQAKFELKGTGPYKPSTGGHHPIIGSAFEGATNYSYKEAFSISNKTLDDISGIDDVHSAITGQQNSLYSKFAKEKKPLTIEKMAEIEIEAMVNVGYLKILQQDGL